MQQGNLGAEIDDTVDPDMAMYVCNMLENVLKFISFVDFDLQKWIFFHVDDAG